MFRIWFPRVDLRRAPPKRPLTYREQIQAELKEAQRQHKPTRHLWVEYRQATNAELGMAVRS